VTIPTRLQIRQSVATVAVEKKAVQAAIAL
jgi:hypothetical protein